MTTIFYNKSDRCFIVRIQDIVDIVAKYIPPALYYLSMSKHSMIDILPKYASFENECRNAKTHDKY